ncbi:unnamed protein product, partial [marine sediment metagenome]
MTAYRESDYVVGELRVDAGRVDIGADEYSDFIKTWAFAGDD